MSGQGGGKNSSLFLLGGKVAKIVWVVRGPPSTRSGGSDRSPCRPQEAILVRFSLFNFICILIFLDKIAFDNICGNIICKVIILY